MGLNSDDAYISELQPILRIAHALRDVAGVSQLNQPRRSPLTNNPRSMVDAINLPNPHPLLPSLLQAGFDHELAASISEVYQLRAEELKRHIQESVITTGREIAELPIVSLTSSPNELMRKFAFISTGLYLRRLEQWKEEIIQRMQQARKTPIKATSRNSRTFNYEHIPLLERFFEENPFPTHADKMFLAKKSNMEYRQIHVWFQNRRNRTKKEGKILRKARTCERARKTSVKLCEPTECRILPPKPFVARQLGGSIENHIPKDAFTSPSPPHAFPSSYPPPCHYDPFPCKGGTVYFGKPEWRRTPDGKRPLSPSISIDDLAEKFSRLNVRDGTHSKGSPKSQSHAATAAFTVIPSRAPHPSLIACRVSQPTNIVQLLPSTRVPVPCPKAFQGPSPTSKPVTLVPLSAQLDKNEPLGKRKTRPFSLGFPDRTRNACRDATPSESYSTPSSPCLFSSKSRGCSPSNTTPLFTPQSNTGIFRELPPMSDIQCRSPLESPTHLRDFGDMAAIPPPSVS